MTGLLELRMRASSELPFQAEGVESVSLLVLSLEEAEVSLPLVPDHFAAGETPDGNYHTAGWANCSEIYYSFHFRISLVHLIT